jgi:RHS repeat-associated protein
MRFISLLAVVSFLLGCLGAVAVAAPHQSRSEARAVVHRTRLVRSGHPSPRVLQVRGVRVVRTTGRVVRARVVPWPGRGATSADTAASVRPGAQRASAVELTAFTTGSGDGDAEFPTPTQSSEPVAIAVTPDDSAWFTELAGDKIGRVTESGSVTEYPLPGPYQPAGISVGADGNLWFGYGASVGRITRSGSLTYFQVPDGGPFNDAGPGQTTPGPDGNVWFASTGLSTSYVGYVTPAGAVTEFAVPGDGPLLAGITAGPEGAVWFVNYTAGQIDSITTAGALTEYQFPSGYGPSYDSMITTGPDGRLWFVAGNDIGAMTPGGVYTLYQPPPSGGGSNGSIAVDRSTDALVFVTTGAIGQVTTSGLMSFASTVGENQGAGQIGWAPDGTLWYADTDANAIGMLPPGPAQFPPPVPVARTYGCACQTIMMAARPESYRGDPVNTATGAYSDTVTDASLPGPGVAFAFTRAYTSLDTASGPLGQGWVDPYQASLSFGSGGNATFTSADGQQMTFTDSGGTYTPAPGVYATLAAVSGGYQLTAPDGTLYSFNSSGQLTSETDRSGTGLTMAYSGSQLASVTTAGGRTVTFAYNSAGLLASLTMPNGTTVSYGYTGGLLTSVTGLGGGVTQYAYNSAGQLTTITDPDGNVVLTNAYDPTTGRVTSQTNGDGQTTSFSWDAATQTATTTDPDGGTWTDVYNDNVLLAQTDPDGGTTYYTYDANLDLIQVIDPLGYVTDMTYNAAGDMLTQTAPAPLYTTQSWTYNSMNEVLTYTDGRGNTTTNAYNTAGLLTSSTDPAGKVTSYTYYPDGQTDTVTDPDGHVTSYTYDSSDDLASVTDPAGNVTRYAWNSEGQLTGSTDPAGNATSYAYNNLGELTSSTDPLGNVTCYGYDADGRETSSTSPAGDVTSYAYDPDGNQTSVTDPLGDVTSYTYGSNGKVATETDPEGHVTSYAYNDDGDRTQVTLPGGLTQTWTYNADQQVTSYTDPGGNTTTYVSDPLGRVTSQTNAEGETTGYTYDGDGNQVTTTSPEGLVTTSTYDPDNRLTAVAYSDGVTPGISYTYDPAGLLTSMTDGTGTTTYTSNPDGQPTTVTNGAGQSVSYAYNPDGNPTTITYPNGENVTDTYNAGQQLTGVTDWDGNTTSFGYNKDGVLTSEAYANGDTAAYTLNADDQTTAITDTSPGGTTLAGFAYTIGKDGELTAATTTGSAISAPAQTYTYNPLSQLTGTGTASYGYDNAADPTTLGATSQTFNPGGQLATATTSGTTTSYAYNADGDRTAATTSGTTTSYGYNQADQLTSYTPATGAATTYAYNGDGLLMSQTTSGTTTSFTWDTISSIPVMLTAGTTSYLYGPGGLPVESVPSSGTPTYYMQDQLGSTRLLTSSSGAVTGTYTYDPWGNITSQTGTATTPFLYAGQYQDPGTGFYYLRNRWYDPVTAQFLTIDPAVTQTQAPYTYTSDNPLNATDPSGLMLEGVDGGAVAAIQNPTSVWGPDCSGMLAKFGACPSQSGAAGTCPEQIENSLIGAVYVVGGTLLDPLLDIFGPSAAAEDTGSDLADAATCGGASFTAGTRVLLASGAAIPISQLKPGDKVLATNTKTGKTSAEPVAAVMVHHDSDLYDLTVRTARGTAVIDTTTSHLFWNQTTRRWTKAAALDDGTYLRASDGAVVTVLGGGTPVSTAGWMWDLSVPGGGDHDFYVDTAIAAVLVHNCPVNPEEVHGELRASERSIDEPYVWDNYDQQYIQESNGAVVRVLDNGNGTSDVVIRYGVNPQGADTVMRVPNSYIEDKLSGGAWTDEP